MFLILYARILDNKKQGLELEGPFFGPECDTMQLAHEECRKIVTPSKDHILVKIYDLAESTHQRAKDLAGSHFKRIFDQMESAQLMCDTPRRRRK